MNLNAEEIAKLKAEHGKLVQLDLDDDDSVVVKTPNRPTWKRFQSQLLDESKRLIAVDELVRACVVHPDRAGLEALLDRKPGVGETILKELQVLAGARADVQKKVL